ncbi:MAG: hypothetical protein GF383_10750 [Candidatus Lokiarchaeota archaeon]|nr:hypothetical protein [Candidatus Lokiarchaeota archaeon]MBD3341083.1 hypothetical protein [Candidatus Lokiarchaeota archaeon]
MQKSDYITIINENVIVFDINLPQQFRDSSLTTYLNKFNEEDLKKIAGFNKVLFTHFFKISSKQPIDKVKDILDKLEKLAYMVSPVGNLNYIGPKQIEYILGKIEELDIKDINEVKVSKLADQQLESEFGSQNQYDTTQALENQLANARFYLSSIGYPEEEINQKIEEVRSDPSKLDVLFTLQQKEIYSVPTEIANTALNQSDSASSSSGSAETELSPEEAAKTEEIIDQHIRSLHQETSEERAQKVEEIMERIKKNAKDKLTERYEKVFRQMHPDRLNRAQKILKDTKRKSKRFDLLQDWFFCSHLLSSIELKVEHWQVSSQAGHGNAGVYTAGIDFSRYDNIVREFSTGKLEKVIRVAKRILRTPSKRAIQKLGQDLVAETGFDEHLYFTD